MYNELMGKKSWWVAVLAVLVAGSVAWARPMRLPSIALFQSPRISTYTMVRAPRAVNLFAAKRTVHLAAAAHSNDFARARRAPIMAKARRSANFM